ncbi:UTP--glucose-1-phosphate uridylyltransferase GalU [Pelagibaculum spongiae]|uniref:UTP--glucose-1-phosphate uridylyltransferase n=1 Tax=Pelagibaculum spongiae TaxID=2080658 RepID=A0A2V1GX32_9GAMM|nr:UTP--glucose-1-phosphate uridylyltransferase GalU [Pelagibaculum spongiae]PVZ70213.1 UTP--glucose-1-phosphate uridylyltransferase [Pelagibaculum spongiae]
MTKRIRKAVFPVAGMGTRFLPATKACPKEMLPVVDKPLIQYAVDEAVSAGITELIFVTSWSKRAIEDHFDSNFELEYKLEKANKLEQLEMVKNILPKGISCSYVRQHEALGLGHAVLCAKSLIGNEPFAVLLADDMIYCEEKQCLDEMIKLAEKQQSSVVAVEEVPMERVHQYGVIDPVTEGGVTHHEQVHQLKGIVEKPAMQDAPSNLSVVGRYVLQPEIFTELEATQKGTGGEIQLTDAIASLLEKARVFGYQFEGTRYDCGSKLGYMKANVEYALRDQELGEEFETVLKECMAKKY